MSKIEICPNCKGEGKIITDVGIHYTEWETKKCQTCKGSGRVLTRQFSYIVPFDTIPEIVSEAETKIFKIINDLEENSCKF